MKHLPCVPSLFTNPSHPQPAHTFSASPGVPGDDSGVVRHVQQHAFPRHVLAQLPCRDGPAAGALRLSGHRQLALLGVRRRAGHGRPVRHGLLLQAGLHGARVWPAERDRVQRDRRLQLLGAHLRHQLHLPRGLQLQVPVLQLLPRLHDLVLARYVRHGIAVLQLDLQGTKYAERAVPCRPENQTPHTTHHTLHTTHHTPHTTHSSCASSGASTRRGWLSAPALPRTAARCSLQL